MTFTLTVTPEPFHTPPRCLLQATESDSDNPIQSCTFYRDGSALRFAAVVAGQTAFAYDYDAPFDVALTYRADAVEADTLDLDFTESWSDLTAWTSEVAGWSAAAGVATSSTSGAIIRRDSSGDVARVTGPTPSLTGSVGSLTVAGWNGATFLWSLTMSNAGSGTITLLTDSGVDSVAHTLNDWTIDVGTNTVTASGTAWSLTLPIASSLATGRIKLSSTFSGGTSVSVDDISVYILADPPTVDVSDEDTTSLTGITAAWLTNSAQPSLAIDVTPDRSSVSGLVFSPTTRRETSSQSSSVQLQIEGSSDVLTVVTGPRLHDTWSMELICPTGAARDDLATLLANSATVSLRLPANLAYMRLPDGFYAVGDVAGTRLQTPWIDREEISTVVLPLTPSRAPSFDVQWTWTWAALASSGMTWDDVVALFPTWNDLLIGPTS